MSRGLLVGVASLALVSGAYADLFDYIAKADDAYAYKVGPTTDTPQGKVHAIDLTSQVWQGITWTHALRIYEPRNVQYGDVMGLMITGGKPDFNDDMLGLKLATMMEGRFAVLYDIPNQPLFDGLTEDALISYTWMKYLESGDETWPLLFPMVKSALRAMDCLEEVSQAQFGGKPRGFLVTGASKRGWTTYLTAIADPKRVIGIAPMVFDILNMPVSIQHQKDFWGDFSPEINDYTEKGLQKSFETERGFRLAWIQDPYTYRDRLTMPKLIVLGSNDPYWPTDAVNLYYLGLPTPRQLLIAPNSGHGLDDLDRVLASTTAFFRRVAAGKPLPEVSWEYAESPEGVTLSVKTDSTEKEGRVWVAHSSVQDFRKAKWEEVPLEREGDARVAHIARAEGNYTACYGEVVFQDDGGPYYLSTQPKVMHPVAK